MARPDEFVLTADTARRVIAAVKYFESLMRGGRPERTAPRHVPYRKIGKLTTAMIARSGSTPGSGTVQPYVLTKTSLAPSPEPPVALVNWTGSAPASGTLVCYTAIDGVLAFDGNDCSAVAAP